MPTLTVLISPAPYADNQLICSLCDPKHSCTLIPEIQQQGLVVGPSSNFFHPKITPEMISEGSKIQHFPGGHVPRPP